MPAIDGINSSQSIFQGTRISSSKAAEAFREDLDLAEDDFDSVLEYFGSAEPAPEKYLEWIFVELGQARNAPGRFQNGAFPVLYTALELATAAAELSHHLDPPTDGSALYMRALSVSFEGEALDARPHLANLPWLVDPAPSAYPQCTLFSGRCRAAGIDALCTKSARRPDGSCLPIFSRHTVTVSLGTLVRFRYRPATGLWDLTL